jgi:pyridoxal phosphate enzyme (YggS family)
VQLVAVSKTKPIETIIEAYETGQRHFGENYVQELLEKAHSPVILEKCKEINWHFIGHLQGNKVNKVVKLPRLHMIETIDSVKLAEAVNSSWEKNRLQDDGKLKILIQVNTSGEENKSGIKPDEITELYKHVKDKCTALEVAGLMTIGEYGFDYSQGPNPDFVCLMECAARLPNSEALELSFGMSDDFERAVS